MCFIYYCNCDSTTDASRAVCLPPDSHLMWFIYFWSVRAVTLALSYPVPPPLSVLCLLQWSKVCVLRACVG